MAVRDVVVRAPEGLHARPATEFTQLAATLGVPVTVTHTGRTVNAASILSVLALGVQAGDTVRLEGREQAAVDALAAQLERAENPAP